MDGLNNITHREFLEDIAAGKYRPVQQPQVPQPPVQPLPVQHLPVHQPSLKPLPLKPLPVKPRQILVYDSPTPQNISEKRSTRFKKWFFKGRIEKKEAKEERIRALSNEYNEGRIIKIEEIGEKNG